MSDISQLVKMYQVQKCVDCKEYNPKNLDVKESELFRVEVKPYLCPPCFSNHTTQYYARVGVSTSQPDPLEWMGWET